MTTNRKALLVFITCAVLYLVLLPALPETGGPADDLVWLLGVLVALTGIAALVVAVRSRRADRRTDRPV